MKQRNVATGLATGFGGGAVVYLSMLTLAPSVGAEWALGVSAVIGAIVGYLGPNFRTVIHAIPVAAKATAPQVPIMLRASGREVRRFFAPFRPVFWLSIIIGVTAGILAYHAALAIAGISTEALEEIIPLTIGLDIASESAILFLTVILLCAANEIDFLDSDSAWGARFFDLLMGALMSLAAIGLGRTIGPTYPIVFGCGLAALWVLTIWFSHYCIAQTVLTGKRMEGWIVRLGFGSSAEADQKVAERIAKFKGWSEVATISRQELTAMFRSQYWLAQEFRVHEALDGPFTTMRWWMPPLLYLQGLAALTPWLAKTAIAIPKAILVFLWTLVRIIHEDIRLICAVDVPLGGITAYAIARVWFGNAFDALNPVTQLLLCLGAGGFTASVALVSVRIIAPLVATRRARSAA